ncbi:MAG: outer membrane protein assembly factor BamC [Methylococcales bacterium]|nr:outer membrane protein assembly factor BamC [Methylococcales bacterium]
MKAVVKFIGLMGASLLVIGCNSTQKHHDNAVLERPPTLEISHEINAPALTETTIKTGLNSKVTLLDSNHLNLKQPFEQAWTTIATALEFHQIEIKDRDQEAGTYFVNYDPDDIKTTNMLDNLAFFLFKDDYAKAAYKIILTKKIASVDVTAEKLDHFEMDFLDDGDEITFDDKTDDGADKLIHHLYGLLKNDLPLD